jgi:DNA-binding FadR family transcriptional regulator
MAQYREIADRLRARIQSGEFQVGDKLPSISEIQEQYGVRSLNTVRTAQQLLSEEGLLETRRGVGAFVTGTESLKTVDVHATLTGLRDQLTTVLSALDAQTHRHVTIDLDDSALTDVDFVLTAALHGFADEQRDAAEHGDEDDREFRIEWAETAERLIARIQVAVASAESRTGAS